MNHLIFILLNVEMRGHGTAIGRHERDPMIGIGTEMFEKFAVVLVREQTARRRRKTTAARQYQSRAPR